MCVLLMTRLLRLVGRWARKPVNHTSWVAVVIPNDRPKSVRNRCLIELFCGVVCVVTYPSNISVGVGAFVIGLGQISSFLSFYAALVNKNNMADNVLQNAKTTGYFSLKIGMGDDMGDTSMDMAGDEDDFDLLNALMAINEYVEAERQSQSGAHGDGPVPVDLSRQTQQTHPNHPRQNTQQRPLCGA